MCARSLLTKASIRWRRISDCTHTLRSSSALYEFPWSRWKAEMTHLCSTYVAEWQKHRHYIRRWSRDANQNVWKIRTVISHSTSCHLFSFRLNNLGEFLGFLDNLHDRGAFLRHARPTWYLRSLHFEINHPCRPSVIYKSKRIHRSLVDWQCLLMIFEWNTSGYDVPSDVCIFYWVTLTFTKHTTNNSTITRTISQDNTERRSHINTTIPKASIHRSTAQNSKNWNFPNKQNRFGCFELSIFVI